MLRRPLALLLGISLLASCAGGRYRAPGLLAGAGAVLGGSGAVMYALGDRNASTGLERSGAAMLALGVGLILSGGIWAALRSRCEADADCEEAEYCQRLYTTAGLHGHCVAK